MTEHRRDDVNLVDDYKGNTWKLTHSSPTSAPPSPWYLETIL